jgi:predicted RNA binding protein YcfA (HicA-like mRNA interferase family)
MGQLTTIINLFNLYLSCRLLNLIFKNLKNRSMTAKEVIKLLEKNGWSEARQTGSHKIFKHPNNQNNIPVPVHSGKDLKKGTLHDILKKAEIKL